MRSSGLVTIHQPQYIPYIGLLAKIDAADVFVFFDSADYQRGYFDNRNRILTKNGLMWLTVPVHRSVRTPLHDTPIAGTAWIRKHLRTLRQSYGKAPYFEPYYSQFHELITLNEYSSIGSLAEATTCWLLTSFGITTATCKASVLGENRTQPARARLIEMVKKRGGDGYLSGSSWRHYLTDADVREFHNRGIRFFAAEIIDVPYKGYNGSCQNLSAIDLLFSLGSKGIEVIRRSIRLHEIVDG